MRFTRFALAAALSVAGAAFALTGAQAEPIGSAARSFSGVASWYSMGHTTANGESYNPDGISAAHRSLPFGTKVTVTNKKNGRSVTVRINDRGPFVGGRVIDLSRGAARQIGMIDSGVAQVSLQIGS